MTGGVRAISVFGCGYLGATHAAVLAHHGFEVIGVEPDAGKVAVLNSGRAPFYEPELDRIISEGRRNGRLRFTTDAAEAAEASVHFICVGTPQRADGSAADTSQVQAAVERVVMLGKAGDVVVGKSTVPVGTAGALVPLVAERGMHLVWNPEFLREGFAVSDTVRPDRIVVGCDDRDADGDAVSIRVLRSVYQHQIREGVPFLVTSLATAELVKSAANAFLATKVSFINAVAEVCDATGADVVDLATAIGIDNRIGARFLRAGIGFGGGCLPKDIRALAARSSEVGGAGLASMLGVVDEINLGARARVLDAVRNMSVPGGRVTVLGLSFKPGSDDVRDSPAVALVTGLVAAGYTVTASDPMAAASVATAAGARFEHDPVAAVRDADCVVIATEWQSYQDLDPAVIAEVVAHRRIVDARNCLDPQRWSDQGFEFVGIGRGHVRPDTAPRV